VLEITGYWSILQVNLKPASRDITGDIMKFKIFSMLFILGVISVLPMIYMGQFDPLGLITGFNNKSSERAKLGAKAPENMRNVVTDKKVQVYKWRDKNGVMQFSTTPPPGLANTEQLELNPNSNLMQAVKSHIKEEQNLVVQAESPNPYTVQGMKKVMDDARGVEELLRKRQQEQQSMIQKIH
jgi:hypothetical protein